MDRLLSRRDLLSLSAAGSAYLVMRQTGRAGAIPGSLSDRLTAAPPDVVATYRAEAAELDLAGRVVSTVAYNGSVPGPTLRARAGDVVEVTSRTGWTRRRRSTGTASRSTMRWTGSPD